jgi:hypothetical protein
MQPQYFSRDGRLLSKDEALGPGGYIRDGVICRVALRDGASRIFDDHLHRPGFRSNNGSSFGDYLARDDRRESYRDYEESLVNSWRKPARAAADAEVEEDDADDDEIACPQCESTGEVGRGVECPRCYGSGSVPALVASNENDKRTVQQKMRDHKVNMDRIYQDHAAALENEWRKR